MLNNDYVDDILNITKEYISEDLPIEKNDLLNSIESYNKITDEYINSISLSTVFWLIIQ